MQPSPEIITRKILVILIDAFPVFFFFLCLCLSIYLSIYACGCVCVRVCKTKILYLQTYYLLFHLAIYHGQPPFFSKNYSKIDILMVAAHSSIIYLVGPLLLDIQFVVTIINTAVSNILLQKHSRIVTLFLKRKEHSIVH